MSRPSVLPGTERREALWAAGGEVAAAVVATLPKLSWLEEPLGSADLGSGLKLRGFHKPPR